MNTRKKAQRVEHKIIENESESHVNDMMSQIMMNQTLERLLKIKSNSHLSSNLSSEKQKSQSSRKAILYAS